MNFFLWMQARRYPALAALAVVFMIARFAFTIKRAERASAPDRAGPPAYRAAPAETDATPRPPTIAAANIEEQTRTILNSIRLKGRRVSLHARIGGIAISAASLANPNDVVSAEINDASQPAVVNELRCAQALAKKLGLTLDAGPATKASVQSSPHPT